MFSVGSGVVGERHLIHAGNHAGRGPVLRGDPTRSGLDQDRVEAELARHAVDGTPEPSEIVGWLLMADREIARDLSEYDGGVLLLETSEEMPSASEVFWTLRNMGERGLLQRFAALLMGRPKTWSFAHPNSPEEGARYAAGQREAVRMVEEQPFGVVLLVGIAVGFLVLFLIVPLAAVFVQALEKGGTAYLAALREPMALSALKLTLLTAGVAVPGRRDAGTLEPARMTRRRTPTRTVRHEGVIRAC